MPNFGPCITTDYLKELKSDKKSQEVIENAHKNINKFLKKGDQLVMELENDLRNIMWKNCGVVKNKELLSNVIKSREIFIQSKNIYNEIDELNKLTIEVNKNWNDNIDFCYPYINLLYIDGGNSN